jgi:hypothetical protein
VADSHSNKDEQPDASFVFAEKPTLHPTSIQPSVGAAISRDNGDAKVAMSAAANGSSRHDFSEHPQGGQGGTSVLPGACHDS